MGNGKTILERYVVDSAEKSLKSISSEQVRRQVIDGDLSEKDIFDDLMREVEMRLQELIDNS